MWRYPVFWVRPSSESRNHQPETEPVYPFPAECRCPSGRRQPAERLHGGPDPLRGRGADEQSGSTRSGSRRSLLAAGLPVAGVPADVGRRDPSGWRWSVWVEQLLAFSSSFCSVASSGAAGPSGAARLSSPAGQSVTGSLAHHGGFHDLPERWLILGACRAGGDWFSPSGAASGCSRRRRGPTSVGSQPKRRRPDIGLPPRRSRWVAVE